MSTYHEARRIHAGARFLVARARRTDGVAVVIKRAASDRPELRERLAHEYQILRMLDLAGAPRPLELTGIDGQLSLVLTDVGPRNLGELLAAGPLTIGCFLELALPMAELVGALHDRGVIHRDLSPPNFVLSDEPAGIRLVDFESATVVPAFAQAPGVPGELEGTLAYMPPEQTGRMRRLVDRRADLYALGATFYEMLTGRPPFALRDPLELVHAHAARAPDAPAVVNPTVPTLISDVVLKLLAKMPEQRYQTATALVADLAEARRQWQARGEVTRFELGRQDLPYGLFLPQGKLYGRDHERAVLAQAIERVLAGGGAEVFLISGPAGIGKSALAHELGDTFDARCRLLVGRGELFQANVPLVPLLDAFGGAVRALAAPERDRVREAILRAVAPNARVLTDAIPELRALLGEQPPVAEVGAVEAQNRFQLAFTDFVRALIAEGPPLVLFVDDLQWVDAASLKLLRALATDPEMRALLVLGAYRSEEVGPGHFVAQTIESIRAAGGRLGGLALGALDAEALVALLCDALGTEPERAAPLAASVRRKTAGNPFFVRQFLGYLYRQGLLTRGPQAHWTWDLDGIDAAAVTPNVVDLLAKVIELLPDDARAALSTAACIGSRFELGVLAGVQGRSFDEVARTLWRPIQEGLLVPAIEGPRFRWARTPIELGRAVAPTYRFVHDRVQEAAYERLSDDDRKALHLRIGHWLEENAPPEELDAAIGPIVDQLDRAADRLPDSERVHVAELNERAARQARAGTAYAGALRDCRAGLALLPPQAWASDLHGLWFALQRTAAECAGLVGDAAASEQLIDEGIARCQAPLEQAELQAIGVRMNALRGAHAQSIARGLDGLGRLGMELPRELSPKVVRDEKERVRALLGTRSERQLLDAPPMDDPIAKAELRLLVSLASAWFTAPELFKVVSFRAAGLTAERGLVPAARGSAAAYAFLGVALAMEGDYREAYQYGRMATVLAERFANPAQESRALLCLGGHVSPWRAPLAESVPILRRAYARGVESGDLEFAAYALANLVFVRMMMGAPLDEVLVEATSTLAVYRRIRHLSGVAYVQPFVRR